MKFVEVGGVRLSAIGLGTWQFGSREWGYGDAYAEGTAVDITQRALDLGINLIDTAEIYAFGRSERIVGKAIAERRADAFLATKVFPVLPLSSIVQQRGVASADRLGVDRIDLYQVHWPNPVVPMAQPMAGMQRLQRTGLVQNVGVSNFSLTKWQEAEAALGGRVLSNQVQYSLVTRKPDRELVPWAQQNDRLVIAYSPLAQGFLSARYDGTNTPGGVRSSNSLFLPENIERAQPLLTALKEIAVSHSATPAQVALAWVIRRPNVVAIPGASSVSQLEANAAAADLELTDDDDHRLTAASDRFEPIRGGGAIARMIKARLPGFQ
ncbi:MAG TPA: aldo/keto reductase [Acidimicrobiales bacterium]|nr:aldo/keto reductase [Acidimicrobiales bacterium]